MAASLSAAGDGEAVVLARHQHAARALVEHRVVGAAMAEGELEGLVPGREADELVAEADAEHRHRAQEPAHGLGLRAQWLGVAGAVREHDAVEALELVGLGRVREDGHRRPRPSASRRRIERFVP